MFQDVDETIRAHLLADVPIDRSEVDISFERPTREWSARLTKPTLNVFLFDIRERTDFRDDAWKVRAQENGRFERTRAPRRVDLAYLVSAWTKEPADEHRILGRVLPSLYRTTHVPADALRGALRQSEVPVLGRVMPGEHVTKAADFWGVMDNELRATLTWVLTVPLDVFAAQAGPLVTTSTLTVHEQGAAEPSEVMSRVGGVVREKAGAHDPVAFARIQVQGTGASATSGADGRFVFDWVPRGKQTWRVEPPGRKAFDVPVDVPSPEYTIEVGEA